jgi:hypothetical protein
MLKNIYILVLSSLSGGLAHFFILKAMYSFKFFEKSSSSNYVFSEDANIFLYGIYGAIIGFLLPFLIFLIWHQFKITNLNWRNVFLISVGITTVYALFWGGISYFNKLGDEKGATTFYDVKQIILTIAFTFASVILVNLTSTILLKYIKPNLIVK